MKDLTKGNIYKTFFLFGFPLVLSGLLSQAYATIDTAIAGRFLGDHGLAAMGATAPLIQFLCALFWGYGVGFSTYIARLFGAKDYKKIKSAVYTTVLVLFVICAAVCLLMIGFRNQIMDLLKVDEEIRKDAIEYFVFYVAGLFPIIMTSNGLYIMNAFGIGTFPFFMSILSAALNITGNILSVTVLKMGIKGLALASVFAAVAVDVGYVFKFRSCMKEMEVDGEKAHLGLHYVKSSFSFSLPNMAQQGVMYLASLGIAPLVNSLGAAASASYSVVFRVFEINNSVYSNSTRAVSNYTSQCVGHKKYYRIKRGVWAGLLQAMVLVTPFILVTCLFPEAVCSIFFKADASLEAREYAYLFARRYQPFAYFHLVTNLFHALYRGSKATGHLFFTTFLGALARYVCSLLLMKSYGMEGFYLGWVLSWVIEDIFAVALFFLGKWNPEQKESATEPEKAVES